MTKQRSRQPPLLAFGRRLATLRGKKRSREQISLALKGLGVTLGGSTLAQYEKGAVWAPDPAVLWGLSKIYRYPHEELIALLRMNRADPDMVEDLATAASSVQPANGDAIGTAPPHDQNRTLPSETAALHAAIRRLDEIANQFRAATAATLAQSRRQAPTPRAFTTRKPKASRNRRG